jgi:serine/threonine-protein kinase
VLYEMLAGKRAFEGDEAGDTLARVIAKPPDWTALPTNTPAPIFRLLRRCLQKDPERRLRDIADARLDIEEALAPAVDAATSAGRNSSALRAKWLRAVPWIVAALFGVAFAFEIARGSLWRRAAVSGPVRLHADLGVAAALALPGGGSSVALSPDGAQLAFVAQRPSDATPRLYLRNLEQLQAALLPETDGALSPFFSPDGRWVAFFSRGKLKKISVSGGAAITLCDAPNGRGGAWSDDGTIAFSPDQQAALSRVSSNGGTPRALTALEAGETTQRWPQFLPGGRAVLYTSLSPSGDFDFEKGNLVVQALPSGARKVVQRGGSFGRYLPSGHLVFVHDGTLFAAAFDLDRLELVSPPVRVLESVVTNATGGEAMLAVSDSGTLVYLPAAAVAFGGPIEWIDRTGKVSWLRAAPANWATLSFAPDGRRLAVDIFDGKQWDIWVDDPSKDTLARLTSSATHSARPVWTPDGRRIVFASLRDDKTGVSKTYNLYWQRADGTGDAQRLTYSTNLQFPGSWHPGGKQLAFEEQNQSEYRLMLLPVDGNEAAGWRPGNPSVLSSGSFDIRAPAFSPDGRWLAYQSSQSGRFEVYVQPFPGPGVRSQISSGGGVQPTWSRTRHELLYGTLDQQIMIVPYSVSGDSFRAEPPQPWPGARYTAREGVILGGFDLHADGDRLALATPREGRTRAERERVVVVLRFFDELNRVAPAPKR